MCVHARTPISVCVHARTPISVCVHARTPPSVCVHARTPLSVCVHARTHTSLISVCSSQNIILAVLFMFEHLLSASLHAWTPPYQFVFMPEHPILASVCDRTLPPYQSIHARTPTTTFYSFHYTPTISVCSCWNTYHECLLMQEYLYQCVFMLEHSPISAHVCLC